ncbi:hypothetical protein [Archangium violaceum]|uniref:hypothetical protein n=1 Tax=Archangium violaceum TaxID=83451 RepID=UPI0037BEEBE6
MMETLAAFGYFVMYLRAALRPERRRPSAAGSCLRDHAVVGRPYDSMMTASRPPL